MKYNPNKPQDPGLWSEEDEGEQLEAVYRYHKRIRFEAGALRIHAALHAIVERQLAEGHPGAAAALQRLMDEGLDRHAAIHSIGSLVASGVHSALNGTPFDPDRYDRELADLTVETWRERFGER
jgi:hypothetical protein